MSLLNPDDSLQSKMAATEAALNRPPFAGFLIRLFAFLIDGLVLYGLAGVFAGMVGMGLYNLNPWLPWIGLAVLFLYLVFSGGPVGKGRTLGMAAVGIHIVDRAGRHLGWAAAFRRAIPQVLAVFGLLSVTGNAAYYVQAFPTSSRYGALLLIMAFSLLGLTLLIALAMSLGIHPHKRAWHDLLAGSYVTRDPTPGRFFETLEARPDPLTERRLKNHLILTVPFWFVAFVVLSFSPFQALLRGQFMKQAQHVRILNESVFANGEQSVLQIEYPSHQGLEGFRRGVEATRQRFVDAGEHPPTTDTLRRYSAGDGETIVLFAMQRRGYLPQDRVDSPEFRDQLERARAEAWQLWPEYRDTWKDKTGDDLPAARRFFFVLQEQAQILAYNRSPRLVATAQGHADPALGPLTIEAPSTITLQAAAALDAATSGTQRSD